jgi:2-polyprenyl-6-methoxyphenol hydroxylase-like FAD-dependent oxidoreductase
MSPTTESRAIVVHARSLEMLDRMGLVQQVIDSGVQTTAMEMHASGRRLARLEFDRVDSPFPFPVTTAQTETERILGEFLGRLGVTVERGPNWSAWNRTAHRRGRPSGTWTAARSIS